MKTHVIIALAISTLAVLPCRAETARATPEMSLDVWASKLPFYFKYDGKESPAFISTWQRAEETLPSEGGQLHRYTFTDPATKLKVTAEVRTFKDFNALDWVLKFSNEGAADTPIIEGVQPLSWTAPAAWHEPLIDVYYGCTGNWESFNAAVRPLGSKEPFKISSAWGVSSHGSLPYFNLCDSIYNGQIAVKQSAGVIGAIGWTGNWVANLTWDRDAKTMGFKAGMPKTHLLLHPGEVIRTPRIVLLNWKGDYNDSANLWRRLVRAYYSPKDGTGQPVTMPIAHLTTGAESIDAKLAAIQSLHDKKVPIDLAWVGGGWNKLRGSWTPDPALYPNGMKPLGEALKKSRFDFALAIEPETGDPRSDLLVQHPDWFLTTTSDAPALLNLGNPAARKGITDLVSSLITATGMTWYHQDFSQKPESAWGNADTPDRVGSTEIHYITGLYAFWDELRARHPGLIIDNSANGGNRLDIEAISRSVALWRSAPASSLGEQLETQSLTSWVPFSTGIFGGIPAGTVPGSASHLYAIRSTYGPGWTLATGVLADDTLCRAVKEFRQVRPFFQGDFYPLAPYSRETDCWVIWQMHRPDLNAGVAIILRRENSPFTSVRPEFRAIDPNARYEVEIRTGLEKGPLQRMSGKDLAKLQVPIPDQPGSALVFYRQIQK